MEPKDLERQKKVYQLIYEKWDDGKFDRTPFYNFLDKELNARQIYGKVYWFESELTPTEISNKIKPFMYNKDRLADSWYIMELSTNMDCWMGSSHVDWIRKRLDFENG